MLAGVRWLLAALLAQHVRLNSSLHLLWAEGRSSSRLSSLLPTPLHSNPFCPWQSDCGIPHKSDHDVSLC